MKGEVVCVEKDESPPVMMLSGMWCELSSNFSIMLIECDGIPEYNANSKALGVSILPYSFIQSTRFLYIITRLPL